LDALRHLLAGRGALPIIGRRFLEADHDGLAARRHRFSAQRRSQALLRGQSTRAVCRGGPISAEPSSVARAPGGLGATARAIGRARKGGVWTRNYTVSGQSL